MFSRKSLGGFEEHTMASFKQFCKAVARENDTGGSRCKEKHVSEIIVFKVWYMGTHIFNI